MKAKVYEQLRRLLSGTLMAGFVSTPGVSTPAPASVSCARLSIILTVS